MADYPDSYFSPREKANKSGVTYDPNKKTIIFKEDFDAIEQEILAIEQELGLNLRDENGNLDLKNKKIVNLADPAADQDAANKKYVDDKDAYDYWGSTAQTITKNGGTLNFDFEMAGDNHVCLAEVTVHGRFAWLLYNKVAIKWSVIFVLSNNALVTSGQEIHKIYEIGQDAKKGLIDLSISAVGSNNRVRFTVTNNNADQDFNGCTVNFKFSSYGNSLVKKV